MVRAQTSEDEYNELEVITAYCIGLCFQKYEVVHQHRDLQQKVRTNASKI